MAAARRPFREREEGEVTDSNPLKQSAPSLVEQRIPFRANIFNARGYFAERKVPRKRMGKKEFQYTCKIPPGNS